MPLDGLSSLRGLLNLNHGRGWGWRGGGQHGPCVAPDGGDAHHQKCWPRSNSDVQMLHSQNHGAADPARVGALPLFKAQNVISGGNPLKYPRALTLISSEVVHCTTSVIPRSLSGCAPALPLPVAHPISIHIHCLIPILRPRSSCPFLP